MIAMVGAKSFTWCWMICATLIEKKSIRLRLIPVETPVTILKPVSVNSLTPLFTAPQILREAWLKMVKSYNTELIFTLQPPSNIRTVEQPGLLHLCFAHRRENLIFIRSLYLQRLSSIFGRRGPNIIFKSISYCW